MKNNDAFAMHRVLRAGGKVHEESREVGELIKTALIVAVSHPGTGRIYTTYFYTDRNGNVRPIGQRPTPHQASAPGESPAPDTMELMNSIDYKINRIVGGTEVAYGSSVEHSVHTEYGTENMAPRPWFRVTIAKLTDKIIKIYAKGIENRQRQEARRLGGKG